MTIQQIESNPSLLKCWYVEIICCYFCSNQVLICCFSNKGKQVSLNDFKKMEIRFINITDSQVGSNKGRTKLQNINNTKYKLDSCFELILPPPPRCPYPRCGNKIPANSKILIVSNIRLMNFYDCYSKRENTPCPGATNCNEISAVGAYRTKTVH